MAVYWVMDSWSIIFGRSKLERIYMAEGTQEINNRKRFNGISVVI